MITHPAFLNDTLRTFHQAESGDAFSIPIHVPETGSGRSRAVLLSVHALVASTYTADFGITAALTTADIEGEAAFTEVVSDTRTTTNRRHRGAMFLLNAPPVGDSVIEVKTDRGISSVVILCGVVEGIDLTAPVSGVASAVGNEADLSTILDIQGGGIVFASAQTRRGDGLLIPGADLTVLGHDSANPEDTTAEVAAALAYGQTDVEGIFNVAYSAEGAAVMILLAAEFRAEVVEPEPEPEPEKLHQIFVIVKDIPEGGSVDIRVVKPGQLAFTPDSHIDWDNTPYTGVVIQAPTDAPEPEPEPLPEQ